MSKKVTITTSSFGQFSEEPLQLLQSKGIAYELNPYGRKLSTEEFVFLSQGAVGVVAGTERITADALTHIKNLKVISRCGVGMDNVDLEAAQKLGIVVVNTPDVVTQPVAELTVGLMLTLLRGIALVDRQMRRNNWTKHMGSLLNGKTVGIVGFGRIGRRVAELLVPFNVRCLYHDISDVPSAQGEKAALEDLLRQVDVVTLHMSGGSGTSKFMDEKRFLLMKKGSYFINCSRGELVDEQALLQSLVSGHLAGAALDVFEKEPYQGALQNLDNVVLTSHIGSYAREARCQMELQAVENLLKVLHV